MKTPTFVADVAQNYFTVGPEEVLIDWVIELSVYLLAYPDRAHS